MRALNFKDLVQEQRARSRPYLKNLEQLVKAIDSSNILYFIRGGGVPGISGTLHDGGNLTYEEKEKVYLKMMNKVSAKLKQYISLVRGDHAKCSEFHELMHSPVHDLHGLAHFCQNVGNVFGQNREVMKEAILFKLAPSLRKAMQHTFTPELPTDASRGSCGSLYLIRTRACINSSESVYKVGRTSQALGKRLAGYDKGCEVIMAWPVPVTSLKDVESAAIGALRQHFHPRGDYGTEYFEGNHLRMVTCIGTVLSNTPECSFTGMV